MYSYLYRICNLHCIVSARSAILLTLVAPIACIRFWGVLNLLIIPLVLLLFALPLQSVLVHCLLCCLPCDHRLPGQPLWYIWIDVEDDDFEFQAALRRLMVEVEGGDNDGEWGNGA